GLAGDLVAGHDHQLRALVRRLRFIRQGRAAQGAGGSAGQLHTAGDSDGAAKQRDPAGPHGRYTFPNADADAHGHQPDAHADEPNGAHADAAEGESIKPELAVFKTRRLTAAGFFFFSELKVVSTIQMCRYSLWDFLLLGGLDSVAK